MRSDSIDSSLLVMFNRKGLGVSKRGQIRIIPPALMFGPLLSEAGKNVFDGILKGL